MTDIYFLWEEELNETDSTCKAIAKYYADKGNVHYEADIDIIWKTMKHGDKMMVTKGTPISDNQKLTYSKIIIERLLRL